jgi:hypothetical protein
MLCTRRPLGSPSRWSARAEYLDLMFIFSDRHLRHVLAEYVDYFNRWRPHRFDWSACAMRAAHYPMQYRRQHHCEARARRATSYLRSGSMIARIRILRPTGAFFSHVPAAWLT